MYPHPPLQRYDGGNPAAAVRLLKGVTLTKTRYICHDLAEHSERNELRLWIEAMMVYHAVCSYEAWLMYEYIVPESELFPEGLATHEQPPLLKASRLAWVADMIDYLERTNA